MFDDTMLNDTFGYHPPPDEHTVQAHQAVRNLCSQFLVKLSEILPDDRPRELAQVHTDVENVMFHANSAIARSAAQRKRVQEGMQAQVDSL